MGKKSSQVTAKTSESDFIEIDLIGDDIHLTEQWRDSLGYFRDGSVEIEALGDEKDATEGTKSLPSIRRKDPVQLTHCDTVITLD